MTFLYTYPHMGSLNLIFKQLLSKKEKEVLDWMVKGYSYKMIAAELNKSVETIRTQVKHIYKKLNVQSNAEAILKALNKN